MILDVKTKIYSQLTQKIPIEEQQLSFNVRTLKDDHQTIRGADIINDSVLKLILRVAKKKSEIPI